MVKNETAAVRTDDPPLGSMEDELPESVDRATLKRMSTVAYLLDDSVRIPGTDRRIGLDPIVSVLPVAGDAAAAVLSLYVVAEAARLGVSATTLVRMLANVAVDFGVGSIPYVGDVFDAAWKANQRNLELALRDLAAGAGGAAGLGDESVDIELS